MHAKLLLSAYRGQRICLQSVKDDAKWLTRSQIITFNLMIQLWKVCAVRKGEFSLANKYVQETK